MKQVIEKPSNDELKEILAGNEIISEFKLNDPMSPMLDHDCFQMTILGEVVIILEQGRTNIILVTKRTDMKDWNLPVGLIQASGNIKTAVI